MRISVITSFDHKPQKIILHKLSRTLELYYADGKQVVLPAAFLRAHSLSAEMRQAGNETGEQWERIGILSVEPVGNYAIRLVFSDGHRTGIYSWELLNQLIALKQGSHR